MQVGNSKSTIERYVEVNFILIEDISLELRFVNNIA